MPLRLKFFLSVVLTLTLVLLMAGFTSNYTTMQAFRNVERRFFQQDMARVQNRLDTELQMLHHYAADWGAWDSMYFFMDRKERVRFDEMIDSASLRALDVDLLALFDTNLLPVVAYTVGPEGEEEALPPALLEDLRRQAPLLSDRASEGAFDDILITGDGAFLAGVSPVLTTYRTGPSRGLLIVGALLEKRLPLMRGSLGTQFDILPLSEDAAPGRSSEDIRIAPNESGGASVWQARGSAVIRIDSPRTIYEKGRDAVMASYLWILLAGMGILIVVTLLLETFVLARLKRLQKISDKIAAEGMIEARVPVEGKDEITSLSRSYNTLLHTLENLLMDIPDAFFLVDPEGAIVMSNEAARAALNQDDGADLRGRDIAAFLGREKLDFYRKFDEPAEVGAGEGSVFEASLLRLDGALVPVEVHRRRVEYGDRTLLLLLARDLTERKQFEERLAQKAYFDGMTGLPNRHSFVRALNRALNAGDALAVAVMNMDHFKLVNAQVGNLNGDRVLMIIAERIRTLLEPPAQLYRTGGDEFAALIPLADRTEEIASLMERIRRAVAAPCPVGDDSVFPSASIGVVLDIADGMASSEVMDAALHAMARARKNGLGRIAYCQAGDVTANGAGGENILTLQAELHAALDRDEFIPFFQPVYYIESGKLSGFETLSRWKHPQKGILPPAAFIPQAEQTGFVANLDTRMLEHALEAINAAHRLYPKLQLFFSSNASSVFLRSAAAVESVKFFLESTGADPTRFTLEVTESALIENLDDVHAKLDLLKESGIRIALDDFGTGYSSLQYINNLPLDVIKLDRAFVSQLFVSGKTERMMRSIITMGRDLGLDIIAEGVETAEQLAWLKSAGCPKAQGYYFSPPVPWDEAQRMIQEV
jgi:diguanylate cyclase (GGDEF)-like protein/PAS domain S-box-containing protein